MIGNSIETLPRKHPVIQNSKEGHEVIKMLTFVGGKICGTLTETHFSERHVAAVLLDSIHLSVRPRSVFPSISQPSP